MKKVCLFGGTFDPAHIGHLLVAQTVAEVEDFEKIIFVMKEKVATLAAGCFWCTEAVFQRLEGVNNVISGFTGGFIKNPPYREVVTGRTGHAEGIQFNYDPKIISFQELLLIFFL